MSLQTYPLISVIVPVYNAENYLENSINKFIQQTYPNFEIVLVDDGSSDGSGKICDDYCLDNNNVHVVHKTNGGASDARNVGIDYAHGELICFADSDDELMPEYIEHLYSDYTKYPDTDLVIQGFLQKWPDYEHHFKMVDGTYEVSGFGMEQFFSEVFINDFSGPYCKLFRKSLMDKYGIRYSKNIIYGEDFDFLLRYIPVSRRITTSSNCNYFYIMHNGSVSSKIYTFEKELNAINQLGGSFKALRSCFDSEGLQRSEKISLSAYVRRLISANYQHVIPRNIRISNIQQISRQYIDLFVQSENSDSFFICLVKYLLKNRHYGILDTLLYLRLTNFKKR